jgi:cytochrome b6-f complex iron-sulfur subunit
MPTSGQPYQSDTVLLTPRPGALQRSPSSSTSVKRSASRRFFLLVLFGSWFAVGWTALTATIVGLILGTFRFMFPNVLSEPPNKIKVGSPDQYEPEKVVDRYREQRAWIVRHQDDDLGGDIIYALNTACTHLGCKFNWLEKEHKFKCPCHGSGFRITGVNFEGPARRPLERWKITVGPDGQMVVDESKKYQKELGQWSDPDSFVKV